MMSDRKLHTAKFALMGIVIMLAGAIVIGSGKAQEVRISLDPPPISDRDALARAMADADAEFIDALTSALESRFRRAASMYENITMEFTLDARHVDAYFSAAYIYMQFLQSPSDFVQAGNLLSIVISNYPNDYQLVADALITRAHLHYRCMRDYRAAKDDVSRILNDSKLRNSLNAERLIEVKVLHAKCCQKLGDYPNAKLTWEEIVFSNPERDSEGRLEWINNSDKWFMINADNIRFFFEEGISRTVYTECLEKIKDGMQSACRMWKISQPATVDVYLYDSGDHLFDYTLRREGFALTADSEIHLAASEISRAKHYAGWVVMQMINTRPDAAVLPLLRAGFENYFKGARSEIDDLAAREIYFYGGNVTVNDILFPLSYDYTFSKEYANMAAGFMRFLIEDEHVDVNDLQRFYRHLGVRPQQMLQPPMMTELLRGMLEDEAKSWQETTLTPIQITGLFQSVLGVDITAELAAWQRDLSDEFAAIEAQIGQFRAEIRRVNIDLSTPEKALESWWEAYRAGDLDGLISASSHEVASLLSDLRDLWVQEGILEQVIVERFIRPYRSANMVIIQQGAFGDNLRVFEVQIERGSEIQEMTVVVRKEGNQWRIDSN
ncbi:MAG TPA: hypothetical protein ENN67_01120 [Firmicutes bacterium]|nr:hypothetical protein [Bacillota bacterium]